MIIIIDAYNLLKQIIKASHVTERERSAFVNTIVTYARKKNSDILLVFDGGQSAKPEIFRKSGIRIVYAGYHVTADDYIKDYIAKNNRQQMLLVSSDRALYTFAVRHRVTTIDALAFYTLMQQELEKQPAIIMQKTVSKAQKLHKDEEPNNPELDALMYESDYVMIKDEKQQVAHEKNNKRLSKEEKRLLKLVKKL